MPQQAVSLLFLFFYFISYFMSCRPMSCRPMSYRPSPLATVIASSFHWSLYRDLNVACRFDSFFRFVVDYRSKSRTVSFSDVGLHDAWSGRRSFVQTNPFFGSLWRDFMGRSFLSLWNVCRRRRHWPFRYFKSFCLKQCCKISVGKLFSFLFHIFCRTFIRSAHEWYRRRDSHTVCNPLRPP